jgi:hypothetical protein
LISKTKELKRRTKPNPISTSSHASNYCVVSGYTEDIEYPPNHIFILKGRPETEFGSVQNIFSEEIRELKNFHREKLNLPRIGEGWIGEISLLNKIRNWFPKIRIVHQWSPSWLGRQRIDIGLPDHSIAIEYHGTQHFQPVDFFGGIEAPLRKQVTLEYFSPCPPLRGNLVRSLCKPNLA